MKVHFDNVNLSARTGPNTFASRLAREFIETGHDVVPDGTGADVSLVFIEPSGRPLAPKVIQRLDGIWFKPDEYEAKNKTIKALYDTAHAVIWQSEFDRNMTKRWWGERTGRVIHNGIDLTPITQVTIPELAKIRAAHDQVFVCSSNWHAQKRLRSNLLLFDHIRKTQHPNSCLFVMGAHPDVMTPDPHVFYTGAQPPEVYLQVFAVSNWMFHLAWADHCPNVVVESLSQGTPVVCSNVGGTREVVDGFGIVVDDQPYNYELYDYDNPPAIDVTKVSLPDKSTLSKHADIDIKSVAQRYRALFDEVLS